ncbi:MAG: PQQ-binding-like beta-propeller repeat protein [Spirochaetaceae bacterium]|nr:PQQ-binding-like beta-propeller repeat protein [Spirochaetaceae bacterium]
MDYALATGRVRDGSRGLAGVPVSNGELITRTAADGSFQLEFGPDVHRYLTVTTPDGYRPGAGCWRRLPLAGGEAVSGADLTLDFALEAEPPSARDRFRFAHVTDPHVVTHDEEALRQPGHGMADPDEFAACVEAIERDGREREPGLAFMLATGDLTDYGTPAQLRAYRRVADAAATPILPGIGAHDTNQLLHGMGAGEWRTGRMDWLADSSFGVTCTGDYERMCGPTHYSFDFGGCHFVMVSNESFLFSAYDWIRVQRWLDSDLALQPLGRPIVIGTHMPPTREWLDHVTRHHVVLVLHGHTHASKAFRYRGALILSTPSLSFGDNAAGPRGYRLIDCEGGRFTSELLPLRTLMRRRSSPAAVAGLREAWRCRLPGNAHRGAMLVVGKGADAGALVPLQDENGVERCGVCRVCLNDGTVQWHTRSDASVRAGVAGGPDGSCFAMSLTGRLLCIDGQSGEERWRTDTPGHPGRWVAVTPAYDAVRGLVAAGAKSGYGAYDAATGAERWYTRFSGTQDLIADPVGDKQGHCGRPIIHDGLLVTLVPRRSLMALRLDDGRIAWEYVLTGTQDWWSAPVAVGDRVVSGGEPDELVMVEAATGAEVWRRDVLGPSDFAVNYLSGIAIAGDRAFLGALDGRALCVSLETGEVLWEMRTGIGVLEMAPHQRRIASVIAPPAYADRGPLRGRVLVCGMDAVLYVLDAQNGPVMEQASLPAPVTAPPVPTEDGLLIATYDGILTRFAA